MSPTSLRGLGLAAALLLGWLVSLATLLAGAVGHWAPPLVLLAVLGRTLLQTGLFIVGHDAMHGVLLPEQPRWNARLGALSLGLYAALPYRSCQRNHRLHHRCEATAGDPDFHPDPSAGALLWYRRFMERYLSAGQLSWLVGSWAGLAFACHSVGGSSWPASLSSVLLVCTLPLLLSSLQLFAVGTYLPHRGQRTGGTTATSLHLPVWASLLACYHFGYHREHHHNPQLAWFELPRHRLTSGDCQSVALGTGHPRDQWS